MANFKNTQFNSTGRLSLPSGTTAQRPSNPQAGMFRFNTSLGHVEYYDGGSWKEFTETAPEATGGFVVDSEIGGVSYRSHIFRTNQFAYVSRSDATVLGGSRTGSSDVQGEVDSLTGCSPLLTFEQALEFVHSLGCRLPTRDELINDRPAVGTGCGYDNELIWTCDKVDAEATQHYVMYGRTETNGTASFARKNSETARVRYVADVNTNRTDPNVLVDRVIEGFLTEYYSNDIDLGTKTLEFNVTTGGEIEYLVVAGGGGGGGIIAGGGGAGGMLTGVTSVRSGTYSITVGDGGIGGLGWNNSGQQGLQGDNSSIIGTGVSIVATGGGGGGWHGSSGAFQSGLNGGSGGGEGRASGPGTGISGQGHPGGLGSGDTGGGGGGAGSPGEDADNGVTGGAGGLGLLSNLSGLNTYYAGGGGDGKRSTPGTPGGLGGIGGGGDGTDTTRKAQDGSPHTGGGGGGAGYNASSNSRLGGKGGSGIVIIRYRKNKSITTAPDIIIGGSSTGSSPFSTDNPAPSAEFITAMGLPSGWYWVDLTGPKLVFVDTEYKGGGWYLVIQNNINSGNGIGGISYDDASGHRQIYANGKAGDDLGAFNLWTGLELWKTMTRGGPGQVAQVIGSRPIPLHGEQFSKRATWLYTGFSAYYAFQGASDVRSTSNDPGMYAYHAVNGYNLTTTDRDQDVSGNNCANNYGGNPFWYGACWSGSAWGGGSTGSQTNGYYWNSSGSDFGNYGATYVRADR